MLQDTNHIMNSIVSYLTHVPVPSDLSSTTVYTDASPVKIRVCPELDIVFRFEFIALVK